MDAEKTEVNLTTKQIQELTRRTISTMNSMQKATRLALKIMMYLDTRDIISLASIVMISLTNIISTNTS